MNGLADSLVVHDVDRDGWGSAALLVATLGARRCELLPTSSKDIRRLVAGIARGRDLWVLDIPPPPSWNGFEEGAQSTTWVDHHLPSWNEPPPKWVRAVRPDDTRPTTTMSLLLRHRLAAVDGGYDFVRRLCGEDEDPWGLAFDGLSSMFPNLPVAARELAPLLECAPCGGDVPAGLAAAVEHARAERQTVFQVLDSSEVDMESHMVVARIRDARGVPLQRYSLALRRKYPEALVVLVHRNQRLYCGRSSQRPGLDLIAHFRARGLAPKGHAYVCTLSLGGQRIEQELTALREAHGR